MEEKQKQQRQLELEMLLKYTFKENLGIIVAFLWYYVYFISFPKQVDHFYKTEYI